MADPDEPPEPESEEVTQATELTATATVSALDVVGGGPRFFLFMKCYWRSFVVIITPVVFVPFILHDTKDYRCAYVYCLMAVYWLTQAIPIPVTALLPVLLLPGLGISKVNPICIEFLREACMVFLLVSLMGYCVDKSGLYKRCALNWMLTVGCTHFRLTLGIFTIAAVGGMLFTNVVTVEMSLVIITAMMTSLEEAGVLRYVEEEDPDNPDRPIPSRTASCYFLGALYCSTIGSTATVVGCGANLATRNFVKMYPAYNYYIQYQMWFAACFIVAVIEVFIVWIWLNISMLGLFWENRSDPEIKQGNSYETEEHVRQVITDLLDEMGPIKSSEIIVGCIYIFAILLWLFRSPIHFDGLEYAISKVFEPLPGLAGDYMSDVSLIVILVFLLSVLPTKMDYCFFCVKDNADRPRKGSVPILEWKPFAKKINWFTFITIGDVSFCLLMESFTLWSGGFALIQGILDSDFLLLIDVNFLKDLPANVILLFFCFITILLTQVFNNTALFFMVIPLAARACVLADVKEFYILVAVGVCCSLCFLLPMGSVPNQKMYSKVKVPVKDMVIAGIVPTLCCFILTYVNFVCLGPHLLKIVDL